MKLRLIKLDGGFFGANDESQAIIAEYGNEQEYDANISEINTRTIPQNSALHVYCQLNADALNDSGQYMACPLNLLDYVEVLWTMESFKHGVWHPIQFALTQEKKSSKLTTVQIQDVYINVSQNMSLHYSVNIPWPSKRSN